MYFGAPLLVGASTAAAGASAVGVTIASGLDDLPLSQAATMANRLTMATVANFMVTTFCNR